MMERLTQVSAAEATVFLDRLNRPHPDFVILNDVVTRIHADAQRDLPWCGPLDDNPSNVMRTSDGRLVLTDPYYADGPDLYAVAEADPDLVVARIAEDQRRYMTEIPLAGSGPWQPDARETMREGLRLADARRSGTGGSSAH